MERLAGRMQRAGRLGVAFALLATVVMVALVAASILVVRERSARQADEQRISDILSGKIALNNAAVDANGTNLAGLEGEVDSLREQLASLEALVAALEARAPVPGPRGATGAQGPPGPPGAPGSRVVVIVTPSPHPTPAPTPTPRPLPHPTPSPCVVVCPSG